MECPICLDNMCKKDILFGLRQKIDFIALSFVRDEKDIQDLENFLGAKRKKVKIIAKIEDQEGLKNIDSIAKVSDGVMVARGDLGIETDLANLPNIQRKIMHTCAKLGKRSIVATHLLESMIENSSPTRAEVTDIANAIYEDADAVMLSGETSIGKYPIECVNFISRIASQTEKYPTLGYEKDLILNTDWEHLGVAVKQIAKQINASGIISITRSGYTTEVISNSKPGNIPIYSFTNSSNTHRQLSLYGSVQNFKSSISENHEKNISKILKMLKKRLKSKDNLKFVVISGALSEVSSDAIEIRNI